MNELNKLIEQYPGDQKEILEYVKTLSWGQTSRERKLYKFLKYFASRPTCGKEQRKFLDEVEKLKYEVVLGCDGLAKELGKVFDDQPIIYGSDFTVNLQKVIKGK